ncbi:hypothetical protein [Brachyspira sp.]|uniref:hypothetical protein n=1 Tax=Brachyspira sp. TaxID=1977261 RepID=UPI002626601D|nr:hypothetical protein [Brachyspira sp.]
MKTIKKLSLIIIFVLAININAFAASGFEAIINVPLGMSVGISDGLTENYSTKSAVGFNSGVTAQIGYLIGLGKIGISILGEFGYSYDSYRIYESLRLNDKNKIEIYTSTYTHSFQAGILPKVNIGAFAIGFGAGVKIPLSANVELKTITTVLGVPNTGTVNSKLNRDDIKNYDRNVIPYIKLTFDYSIFLTSKAAINLGAYLGYDFGLANKNPINNEYIGVDSFDIGFQLGLRFAPKL